MSKRHEGLMPLTHDHHHALAQARRLRVTAKESDEERLGQAREFLDFFGSETLTHFREEEEVVFPLIVDQSEAEPSLIRLMVEHLRIHAGVRDLRAEVAAGTVASGTLTNIASLLEEHIRFEEKTVFPLIERFAPIDLNGLELSPRQRAERSP
jgi:iron-sulfur cluster repair protein YtfE (RIC family)